VSFDPSGHALVEEAPRGGSTVERAPTEAGGSAVSGADSSWFVVLNPAGGRVDAGSTRRRIERGLRAAGVEHEIGVSCAPGHAGTLVRDAFAQGWRRFAIAGGDGTAHQVVNGLLEAAPSGSSDAIVGILPLGTGNDWARSLGIPGRLEAACQLLASGTSVPHDVGQATFMREGRSATRYFVNVAGAGFDGHVVRIVQGRLRGPWRYFQGLLIGARTFSAPDLSLSAGDLTHSGATLVVLISIGRYIGGGMRVAPDASYDDGLFDVTIVRDMSAAMIAAHVPRLLVGSLARSGWVSIARVASVDLAGETDIEADGELLGHPPASFRILPRALRVVVAGPAARRQA